MKSVEDIREYYDNFLPHLAHDHERENARQIMVKNFLAELCKMLFHKEDNRRFDILDLGCGTGISTRFLASLPTNNDVRVLGVDLSPKLIEFAREKSSHERAEYAVADITSPDLYAVAKGRKYDLITLIDCMEHIPPEYIEGLFDNISMLSWEKTAVYVNVPDNRFMSYMQKRHPSKLQIVDEAISPGLMIERFSRMDFECIHYVSYGVDMPYQYASYVFMNRFFVESLHRGHVFGLIGPEE